MDLDAAMRTTGACRYFSERPLEDEVLYRAFEMARFAPQGGNRQGVRFVVVREESKKRQLAGWYQARWEQLVSASGMRSTVSDRIFEPADHFARHFGEHPAIVVACVDVGALHVTDAELDRVSVVGGGSVYPMVQNLCLAFRSLGVGTAITTLLCADEQRIKELLDIPEHYATACHIAAGYPAKGFPKKLTRRPVSELAFLDQFGTHLEEHATQTP